MSIRCPNCNHSFNTPAENKWINALTFLFIALILIGIFVKVVF